MIAIETHLIRRGEKVYVSVDDIVEILNRIAATESTDTRIRLEETAANFQKLKHKVGP